MQKYNLSLFSLLLITFISFFGIALPYPILAFLFFAKMPVLSFLDLPAEVLYGIACASYPLGQFFGAPILGVISDHSGRKSTLIVSLVMTCIGYTLSIVSLLNMSFILFVLSRFFTGFWEGIMPITRAAAADIQHLVVKAKSFGYINAAATAGFLFGPIVGGVIAGDKIDTGINLYYVFWFAFAITIFALLVLLFFYKEPVRDSIATINTTQVTIGKKIKMTWSPIRQTEYFSIIMMSTLITLSFDIYYQFYPVFLVKNWQVSPYDIAIATVWLSIAMILTQIFLIKYLNTILGVKHIIVIACFGFSISIGGMVFINNYNLIMLFFCLLGLFIGLIGTNLPVFVSDSTPKNMQGQIMGLMMSLRFLGDGVMCLLGGVVSSISISAMFFTASIFIILGMLIFLLIKV